MSTDQILKLKQAIRADEEKLEQLTRNYTQASSKLKERLSERRKRLQNLENTALLNDLHVISVSSGTDVREIVEAIRTGNSGRLNTILQESHATPERRTDYE